MIQCQPRKLIELDYGKIGTGKPDQFDGKNPWVSCTFSRENQSSEKPRKPMETRPPLAEIPRFQLRDPRVHDLTTVAPGLQLDEAGGPKTRHTTGAWSTRGFTTAVVKPWEILEDSEDLAGNLPSQNGATIFGRSVGNSGNCEICWRYFRDISSDDLVVGCLLQEKTRILIHNDSLPSNIWGSPKEVGWLNSESLRYF